MSDVDALIEAVFDLIVKCYAISRNYEIFETVGDAFAQLKPLSGRKVALPIKEGSVVKVYRLGNWVTCDRTSAHSRETLSNVDFFYFIRDYGETIAKYVRKEVAEDFLALTKLVKDVKLYENVVVERGPEKFPMDSILDSKFYHPLFAHKFKIDRVDCLLVQSVDPRTLHVLSKGTIYTVTFNYSGYVEPFVEHNREVTKMYYEALLEIVDRYAPIEEYNRKILDEINRIAQPYVVAKSLRRR